MTSNLTHSLILKCNDYTRVRHFSMKWLGERNNPNAIKDFLKYIRKEYK
jgi:hypothetical protein